MSKSILSISSGWLLAPGESIKRVKLHDQFGGSRFGGISPSKRSPNIFIFSDPKSGEKHGYIDDWKDDGCFHYTGEGQQGDQRLRVGNRAIVEADRVGHALRVFKGTGGTVQYVGQFVLDKLQPFYRTDAKDTGQQQMRSVIVFRLRPVDTAPDAPRGLPARSSNTLIATVPVEERYTERMVLDPARAPYEAERRESDLVHRFKAFLERQGHAVSRLRITPAGEAKPLFTDLYVSGLRLLVEAKGTTDRIAIRMAIGQLLDYRRFVESGVRCAVLLPSLPRDDLRALLHSLEVTIYYPTVEDAADFTFLSPVESRTQSAAVG